MPEIFRFFGFVFFFYSREHEPIHVHIEGNGGRARFVYDAGTNRFHLADSSGIKAGDMKKIAKIIEDNTDIIVKTWNRYFKIDDQDN